MTRLYTSIVCNRCNNSYTLDIGEYYGKKLGDKGEKKGVCNTCFYREKLGYTSSEDKNKIFNEIIPYKNRSIDYSKSVEVYRNLNNKCFSIRQNGLVVAHADGFTVEKVTPKISEKGRQRVLQEKRKSVHAVLVCFNPLKSTRIDTDLLDELYYNPYDLNSFINRRTGEVVNRCNRVYFTDGKAYILE